MLRKLPLLRSLLHHKSSSCAIILLDVDDSTVCGLVLTVMLHFKYAMEAMSSNPAEEATDFHQSNAFCSKAGDFKK